MEEENNKLRKAGQRKYNKRVRQLAEFVKNRDKRVLERELHKEVKTNERDSSSREIGEGES